VRRAKTVLTCRGALTGVVVGRRVLVVAVGVGILWAAPAFGASLQDQADCASQDPERAIPACSRIIPDGNESAQSRAGAYVLRSAVYLAQGNVERAIADCNEAIKLTPRNVIAYVRRALAYHHRGDKDRAILDYSIAEKLDAGEVAQFAVGKPEVDALAAAARASPASPAALDVIMSQIAAAPGPSAPAVAAPEPPPAAPPPPPPPKPWNSVAAAIWKVQGKAHVAIGYSGTRPTQQAARNEAEAACRRAGGQGCVVKGAWNFGCVYITTGNATNRAGWGSGGTIADAMRKCQEQGLTCKQPIGGCVE
jgi:tetratricopeptide (TPR) repeat protein